jgi:hypothetical protein
MLRVAIRFDSTIDIRPDTQNTIKTFGVEESDFPEDSMQRPDVPWTVLRDNQRPRLLLDREQNFLVMSGTFPLVRLSK